MKKKIISLCLVLALALTAIGGATLAYFTDTDKADNVFTVGKVTIDLIEQERKEVTDNGETKTVLDDFTQNKPLYPIVGSAQDDKDDFGLPVAKNYVDKVVTIKNTGSEKAYIRAYFAIPSCLDDGYDTFNAGLNVLHFNFGKEYIGGTLVDTEKEMWSWKHGDDNKWNYYETSIDGIAYNVYYADYYKITEANEVTARLVNGVYLDSTFDYDYIDNKDGTTTAKPYVMQKNTVTGNMEKKCITLPEGWNWNEVKCPVFAVGVQAAGFDSVDEAVTKSFGEHFDPWGGTVTNWQ